MPDPAATVEQFVCFFLAGEEYGVAIGEVKETIAVRPITRLFLVPDFIAGLINLRGEVVAVIDLGRLLGHALRAPSLDARIVILRGRGSGQPAPAGLLVDRLADVRAIDPTALRAPPATVPSDTAILFRGVARADDHPLTVLDLPRIFATERLTQFRRRA